MIHCVHWDPNKQILHGLCTLGHGSRAVLLGLGNNDPKRFHALKLRFASPVIPGDVLVTKMWKISRDDAAGFVEPLPEGCERIVFTTEVKATGKVVLGNAYMDLWTEPKDLPAPAKARL